MNLKVEKKVDNRQNIETSLFEREQKSRASNIWIKLKISQTLMER